MDAVAQAFRALRSDAFGTPDRWQSIYRAGLVEAFSDRRFDEAAELAVFAASALDSQGRLDEALAELDFAISHGSASIEATSDLLATKAVFLAISGAAEADAVIESALSLRPSLTRPSAILALDTQAVMVDLVLLRDQALDRAHAVSRAAREGGSDWHAFAIDALAIPLAVATGAVRSARPWSVALLAETQASAAYYRAADAGAIEVAMRAFQTVEAVGEPVSLDSVRSMRRNTHAQWRSQLTALRCALLRASEEETRACLDELATLAPRVNPGASASLPPAAAALRAIGRAHFAGAPSFPDRVTLVNLPTVLAGMEVAAMGGSQDECVAWHTWLERHWPADIHTSLEWGASVERLRALLEVRIGREGNGLARMQRAARWAKDQGFTVEQHVAELQFAELSGLLNTPTRASRWRELREEARRGVRDVGGDPVLLSFIVSDAVAVGRIEGHEPKLSPREVQVLALLAEGLTYRAVGDRLGIEWRTVQVHAKHIYGKLGVNGKMQAAKRGHELGII